MKTTQVRVFYPADPVGVVPGGIDTFLRGLFKWAPEDLSFSLVGMSTDVKARPLGQWTHCELGSRGFKIFPVVAVRDAGARGRVPLSVRYGAAAWRYKSRVQDQFDIFDFHRLEPALLFTADHRPKNAYFHQDPGFIRQAASDNLWRHLPAGHDWLERRMVAGLSSAWCVRESGVQTLRTRYPALAAHIRFIPTWVDADVFHPVDEPVRTALRHRLADAHHIDGQAQWIVTVGRLDTQKDPLLMLEAFARLQRQGRRVAWLLIGDGVLREELKRRAASLGLGAQLHFLGLQPPAAIADWLRAADLYALSSAYEGMPMALLEALGCGLPAAVTDVGEVRRVVRDGSNGAVAVTRDGAAFADALSRALDGGPAQRAAAVAAVQAYQPAQVLAPAYDNYRELGRPAVALRSMAEAVHEADTPQRKQRAVVGVPIDVLDRVGAARQLVGWAQARESRYMCFVNVHSAIQASKDEQHRLALLGADLVAPDGAPIAWTLRVKGCKAQERVDGPDMMWRLCDEAQANGVSIGLYGSDPATLNDLREELALAFPQLVIGYAHSPPFRDLSEAEDLAVCADIVASGVGLLFVGLGCPKQELWMARHRGRVPAVMLGVGAAFEFHAGHVSRAPTWMREHGLEWLHRLSSQPQRLWRRYLTSNSLFVARSAGEAARSVVGRLKPPADRSNAGPPAP